MGVQPTDSSTAPGLHPPYSPAAPPAFRRLLPYFFVFLGVFLLRIIYIIEAGANPLFDANLVDAYMYEEWANRIVTGEWRWDEVEHFFPVYPLFLALQKVLLGASPLVNKLLQSLMSSVAAVLAGLVAERLFGRKAGVLAAILYGTTWMLVVYDSEKFAESFCVTMQTLTLFLIIVPLRRWWTVLLAGLALSLCVGARLNLLLIVPWAAVWLLWVERHDRVRRLLFPALLVLSTVLLVGIVLVRNHGNSGSWMLRRQSTWNYFAAVNPDFGGLHPPAGVSFDKYMRQAIRAGADTRPEIEVYWKQRGRQIVDERFDEVVVVYLQRALMFLGAYEWSQEFDVLAYRSYSRVLSLPWPGMWLFAPLGVAGAILLRPRRAEHWLLLLFLIVGALSIVPFKGTGRYRLPTLMLLAIYSGGAVASMWETRREWRGLSRWGCIVVPLAVISWPDWTSLKSRPAARHEFDVALRLSQNGSNDEALVWYEQSYEKYHWDADSPYRIGTIHLARGNVAQAHEWFAVALQREPDFPEVHEKLAQMSIVADEMDAAIEHLAEAVRLQPNHLVWREQLADAAIWGGRDDIAIEQLQMIAQFSPSQDLHRVAIKLEFAGAYQEALSWYGAVIEDENESQEMRALMALHAGLLFWRHTQTENRAIEFWRRVAEQFQSPESGARAKFLLGELTKPEYTKVAKPLAATRGGMPVFDLPPEYFAALRSWVAGDLDGAEQQYLRLLGNNAASNPPRAFDARWMWQDLRALRAQKQRDL